MAVYTTDKAMKQPCEMFVIDTRTIDDSIGSQQPILRIPISGPRISSILWDNLDESIITGHENGELITWDLKTGKQLNKVKEHDGLINDMQWNKDQTMFITASKDHTAKLFDATDLMLLKTYKTERPVNSAAISPILDHVVVGGGQDAMDVTTTSARIGKFDSRLVCQTKFSAYDSCQNRKF